jgi:DNA-directed RNA polymerase alpha subunit
MRFAMTARTVARFRGEGQDLNEMTQRNVEKVTKYRPNGEKALEEMVEKLNGLEVGERDDSKEPFKEKVYHARE